MTAFQNGKQIFHELREKVNTEYLTTAYEEGMYAYNGYNNEAAIEQLSKVVAMDEQYDNGNALYNLAQAYRKVEDWRKAIEYYAKVIELFPGTPLAYNANRYVTQIEEQLEAQN